MSRIIDILTAIRNGETYTGEPLSRVEAILKAIANKTPYTAAAKSRHEQLLLAIKNGQRVSGTARTRVEEILFAIANGTLNDWIVGKNLFDETSKFNINASINTVTLDFPSNSGGNRYTYFMRVKPNSKYTISFGTVSDRLFIAEYYNEINPLKSITADSTISRLQDDIPKSVTITTGAETKMIGIYYSLDKLPTKFKIEIGSTATPYTSYAFLSDLEEAYYLTAEKLKGA